jgi:chromosome partitioning protein
MVKVWGVSANIGGVLKTTLITNLAGMLSKTNRVLVVDTTSSGNCMLSFGKCPDSCELSIYDVLINGCKAEDSIINVYENIDVLPSKHDMEYFEIEVLTNKCKYPRPFHLLRTALQSVKDNYDVILVDTSSRIGVAKGNALSFIESVLIPYSPEPYSTRGLISTIEDINDFKKYQNPDLSILGVVPTLVYKKAFHQSEILKVTKEFCDRNGVHIFNSIIPISIQSASSVAYDNLPSTLMMHEYPDDAINYLELLWEIQRHMNTELVKPGFFSERVSYAALL